jgi:hypothetical protein
VANVLFISGLANRGIAMAPLSLTVLATILEAAVMSWMVLNIVKIRHSENLNFLSCSAPEAIFTGNLERTIRTPNRQYPFCRGASSNQTASPVKRKSVMDCREPRRDNFDHMRCEVRYRR